MTASVDTEFEREGSGCLKLVVAAGASANDVLATDSLSSTDLRNCDQIEIRIFSTVALNAGDIRLLLDNTASCASPVETLNVPATSANVWTTHVISLANPASDSAIISVGLEMEVDKGAFTLYVDKIKAVSSTSRRFEALNPQHWDIVRGSTNYLKLNTLGIIGDNTLLRISGYQLPALITTETATSEVDPAYIVAAVTAHMMVNHAKSGLLEIDDRQNKATRYLAEAERLKTRMRINPMSNTRWM